MAPFGSPPPAQSYAVVSVPAPHILLVVFNRPRALNCMNSTFNHELHQLFAWYDDEPSLRCAVVTGAGRAFCAGFDLKEWNERNEKKARGDVGLLPMMPPSGFGALSRRYGKKPVVGAVNGLAFGGGMEIVANLDLVVAARGAVFSLPEVDRGVGALAGALPRITRTVGKQRAMELALTAKRVSADEARSWGFVNDIADDHSPDDDILSRPVVKKALEYAQAICRKSPDSIIVSRAGVVSAWEDGSAENATRIVSEIWETRLNGGDNLREGVRAFAEKREPKWLDSKL